LPKSTVCSESASLSKRSLVQDL